MFTVGEFSKLAQVSKRLLRYYDEIGLLKPSQTDSVTGYRYYQAEQMLHLNRILVLRDLGLSLDQIQRILHDNPSTAEIQGMLLLKKAEIEQQLRAELQRVRHIESRLQSIHDAEENRPPNVIIKHIPALPVMSIRTMVTSFDAGMRIIGQIRAVLPDKNGYGLCFCVCHSDGMVERNMDLQLGRIVASTSDAIATRQIFLQSGLALRFGELPSVPVMATCIVSGSIEHIHRAYTQIGLWTAASEYRLVGVPREVTLQLPQAIDAHDLITEVQFPVEPLH